MSELAGAVLCGGRSARMGCDKALLTIEGETLTDRAIARLRTVCDPVIVACGARYLEAPGCLLVPDAVADRGPLGGLSAALAASPHHLCAVVAVDMPDLDAELLAQLASACDGHDAVIPVGPNGPEPLHAVWARSALPAANAALSSDDRSLRSLMRRLQVLEVQVAESGGSRWSVNLNRPEDVGAWRPRSTR